MPHHCIVYGCCNNLCRKECYDHGISFHSFPLKKPKVLKQWLMNINLKSFVPSESSRLCSLHFSEDCFHSQSFTNRRQLKDDAVPTLFLHNPVIEEKKKASKFGVPIGASAVKEKNSKKKYCSSSAKWTKRNVIGNMSKETHLKVAHTLHSTLRKEVAFVQYNTATSTSKAEEMVEEEEEHAGHSGEEAEEEEEPAEDGQDGGLDPLEAMQRRRSILSGRGVTLNMLLSDGILEAGDGLLTIDYLGAKFIGDLLPGGKIRAQETQKMFSSPSSWAIHCKKLLNPDKKSGCGWSSIRYKGKKLDTYKNLWFRKHKKEQEAASAQSTAGTSSTAIKGPGSSDHQEDDIKKGMDGKKWEIDKLQAFTQRSRSSQKRIIVPHSVLGNRSFSHDLNTLVKCTPFSALDRIQPFTVTIATNCLLLVDFHCHLTKSEVVGYLGGTWDIASHNLAVLQAFPCRSGLGDKENSAVVEEEIRRSLERRHLSVVGWYHSHPSCPAQPTIKDVDSQMEYQITMKGDSDSSYTPCLGLICSPYDNQRPSMEADYQAYWVMPPPEHRPHEYGRPMQMIYNIAHDSFLTQDLLMEMRLLSEFYRGATDAVKFTQELPSRGGATYWEKLQTSLRTKLPRDLMVTGAQSTAQAQAVTHFWDFLKGLIMT